MFHAPRAGLKVLTFEAAAPRGGRGSGRPAHRRAACGSRSAACRPLKPYCLSPGGQCAPEPQQR
ncbi:unnamed protein product [Staurois parvus]|uniref:Uncharacterized protein n=1 Tax=Staurois parvus TaxID=386267 RepID=A0ABN9B5A1_9NEOB|nr:unnamed protein product [Staurois parvus]